MRVLSSFLSLGVFCLSCGDTPSPDEKSNGSIDGYVVVTGPVANVVVTAHAFDLDGGVMGDVIGRSEPTGSDGAFHVDLGPYEGAVLLVARGADASYVEPASNMEVAWDAGIELRALFVRWDPGYQLSFEFQREQAVAGFVISPFTDLAVTYAPARVRAGRSMSYAEAARRAHELWAAHVEIDFWATPPVGLTDATGGWSAGIHAGVLLAGWSALARRMAEDSFATPAAVTSLHLLDRMRQDLADDAAQLDGRGPGGALILGDCDTVCRLSSRTLRAHWAEAIALFLGSPENRSGIGVTDAKDLMHDLAARESELFADGGSSGFDTTAPVVSIDGLTQGEPLVGTVIATITAVDAIAMGTISISITRGDAPIETPFSTMTEIPASTAQTRIVELELRTEEVLDGELTIRVDAVDAAGNAAAPEILTLAVDNQPAGHVSGTVTLGGVVAGAEVRAYEYEGGVRGFLLGSAMTDEVGYYSVEIATTPISTILIQAANPPGGDAATYIEGSSGATIALSSDDVIESVITGWADGDERVDGNLTPWTHIGTAFGRGLFRTRYSSVPATWPVAVDDAFDLLTSHLSHGGTWIDLREVRPADLTAEGTTTLNSQARYGLLCVALGQLADAHAATSGATSASINTLSLTELLARDLGEDGLTDEPLFNGRVAAGALTHGTVPATSYFTRVDLAIAAVAFLESNPRNRSPFTELDVAALLDHISTDDHTRLYPATEPPIPYDVVDPEIDFVDPTPEDGTVLRGVVDVQAEAIDNRALASMSWIEPVSAIGSPLLDTGAGLMGPWVLSGQLDTDLLPEGPVVVTTRATDEAIRSADATRTFVIDRTNPWVTIDSAITPAGTSLASGDWTGPDSLTIAGSATDANLASTSFEWNSLSVPLVLEADGTWSIAVDVESGANLLVVHAIDHAGNEGTASATFYRDATPPTVTVVESVFVDDTGVAATISGTGVGTVTYSPGGSEIHLVEDVLVSFTKFSTRYGSPGPGLPEWHFEVADDHSAAGDVLLEVRLSRWGAGVLVDWTPVDVVVGGGYNRSQTISGGFHWDVATVSGAYLLDFRATDELGNTSVARTVLWNQTIKPPPVRQRAGSACSATLDAKCPAYYGLDAMNNNASVAIHGAGVLPGGKLRIAHGYIDNPNSTPVRVRITPSSTASYTRGRAYRNPRVTYALPIPYGCPSNDGEELPDGTCYYPPSAAEVITTGSTTLAPSVSAFLGTTVLAPCATCAVNEFEIPPTMTATVWIEAPPYSFLQAGFGADVGEITSVGSFDDAIFDVTGRPEILWIDCGMDFDGCNPGEFLIPRRRVNILTRLSVSPLTSVSLQSRPAADAATLGTATGTNVTGFTYATSPWSTTETGW